MNAGRRRKDFLRSPRGTEKSQWRITHYLAIDFRPFGRPRRNNSSAPRPSSFFPFARLPFFPVVARAVPSSFLSFVGPELGSMVATRRNRKRISRREHGSFVRPQRAQRPPFFRRGSKLGRVWIIFHPYASHLSETRPSLSTGSFPARTHPWSEQSSLRILAAALETAVLFPHRNRGIHERPRRTEGRGRTMREARKGKRDGVRYRKRSVAPPDLLKVRRLRGRGGVSRLIRQLRTGLPFFRIIGNVRRGKPRE